MTDEKSTEPSAGPAIPEVATTHGKSASELIEWLHARLKALEAKFEAPVSKE